MNDDDTIGYCDGTCGETRDHWHMRNGSTIAFEPGEPVKFRGIEDTMTPTLTRECGSLNAFRIVVMAIVIAWGVWLVMQ